MSKIVNRFMKQANLIDGEWVSADSGATIEVVNPANGQVLGNVPKSAKSKTARAIETVETAFQSFRKTTALERSKMLRKIA